MKTKLQSPSKWLFLAILILSTVIVSAQEICDNGIDDDGDGFIDINDESDCFCGDVNFDIITGDFEEFSNCPNNFTFNTSNGIYNLTDGWGPASGGTSDYFNTCDFLGGIVVPAIPEPIPSGEGAVGLYASINGQETVGVCLDNPMLSGESYDLSFYVGFNSGFIPSPLDINVIMYGTSTCNDFPVVGSSCLDQLGQWEEISSISVSGTMDSSWLFVSTSITANLDYEAIAFGVECPASGALYHFFDNFILEGNFSQEDVGDEIIRTGDCVSGVQLEVPFSAGSTYQWYLDGVAIAGATSDMYLIPNADDEGEYQVVIDDGSNCATSPPLNVVINEFVLDLSGVTTDVQCIGNDDGSINLDIDSPNTPFDIEWNNSEIIEDISGLSSGTYSVTVTDDNGCIGNESFQIIDPPTVSTMVMGDCNSGVEVSVDQIAAGETYQWYYNGNLVPGANTNPYLVPSDEQGDYYVIISNGAACQTSDPIDVSFNTSILDINGMPNDVICFGDETGWIDIEIANDNGPYEYEWSTGWIGQDLYDVGIGMYSVTVSDSYGCSGTATYTIDQPTNLFAFAQLTQPIGSPTAQILIVADGGVQPYTYAWSNGNDTDNDPELPPGTYTVIVTDANGCEDIVIFTIEGSFTVIETVSPAACYGECNGTILLEVDGPPANYSIEWTDSQYNGFDLVDLCAGSYPYSVTDDDGAAFGGVVTITQFDSLVIEAFYQDTLCTPFDTILISTNVTGGTAPYSYLWSSTSVNDSLFDVTVGMYSLTVTDANLCVDSININIAQYAEPIITNTVTLSGCDGEDTGAIDLTVENAQEPISYIWSNGMITQDISNLSIGEYGILITDGNGCNYIQSITVGANTGFTVTEIITDVNCSDADDGMIALNLQNGIEPYVINWSHGPASSTIDNLAPGVYSVEISDASGCSGSYTYTVDLLSSVFIDAIVDNNLCADQATGSIAVTIVANGNDYSVLWNDGSEDESRENLEGGNYGIEVTDEFGCIYNQYYEIFDNGEAIVSDFVIIPDTCGSGGVGSLEIIPISGAMPFTYLWEDNSEGILLENLEGGVYPVTITDNNGCVIIEEAIVSSISDLEVSVTSTPIVCAGSSTASATVIPVGGTAPYEYLWSNDATTASITNLAADISYAYTVTDDNGCVGVGSIMLEDSLTVLSINEIINAPLCNGDEGSISISVEGGMSPYEYLWDTGSAMNMIDVNTGNYSVTVTDLLGCTASSMFTVNEPAVLDLSLVNITDPSSSNDDGSIEIGLDGGTEPYNILWSNGQQTAAINGLNENSYSVTVTDDNGCSDSLSFELETDIPLSAMYVITSNLCFGDCLGSIAVDLVGGVQPYTYLWSDGSDLDSISNLCSGNYQLEITDASGNSIQSGTITITSPDNISVDGVVYDISCLDAQDGSITLEVLGGTSPFDYSWSNNAQGDSISDLTSGNYEVIAMDDNGCSESAMFTIADIPIINIQPELLPVDCGDQDYTIALLGDNDYNYPYLLNNELIDLDENNQITGLLAGEYSLSYLINENCEVAINDFTLGEIEEYELSISTEEILSNVGDTIVLSLAIFSDVELNDYSVNWNSINDYNCSAVSLSGECLSIELSVESAEDIVVTFVDQYGCETFFVIELRLQEIIPEVFIPNVFSPNGDGINDDFLIQSNDDQAILQSMNIFDRWGNLLFVQEDVLLNQVQPWDGSLNGSSINPGVYIYVAEVIVNGLPEIYFGDITLIR